MLIVGDQMEDKIKVSILMDYYKELLTEKQRDIMDLYYNEDLSLSEISEHTNTSRQAIYDVIKRCNKLLINYEKKLKLAEKDAKMRYNKELIIKKINQLCDEKDINIYRNCLLEIKKIIVEDI